MIGERLKELRTARNLSLRDLAAQAGVSATLLSQVERSVTDPSLETVRRLAAVFGESITSLFAEPNAPAVWISRPGNRSKLTAPAGRVSYERLTAGQSDLEVLRAVLAPGQVSADEPRGHPSTECVYVIQGNWWRRSRASTIWSRAARASPSTRGSRTATATTHPGRWRSSCPSRRPVPESPSRASAASAGQTQPCSSFTLSWSNAVQTNPLGILRLDHVSWTVRELEPVVAFYERVFGATVQYRLGPVDSAALPRAQDGRDWTDAHLGVEGARLELAMLALPGGARIEIFAYDQPASHATRPAPSHQIGSYHLGIEVQDLEAAAQILQDNGCTLFDRIAFSEGPTAGSRFQRFLDPWQNIFELSVHTRPN